MLPKEKMENVRRQISFTIKGKRWENSRVSSFRHRSRRVPFIKLGSIVPKEKMAFTQTNHTMETKLKKNIIYQDPDKSGIVLETETSVSQTQNTNSQHSIHHQSLLNDDDQEKPIVNDFDDMNEEEEHAELDARINPSVVPDQKFTISQYDTCPDIADQKYTNDPTVNAQAQREELEPNISLDDPFSTEESDDDLFAATPERSPFKPPITSTTKRYKKTLSQSPVIHKALDWKVVFQTTGDANNLFENFEIALHGDFGSGIKAGGQTPSKSELWQLLTGCGATVYKSVNLFTFGRGITGLCVVNHSGDNISSSSKQITMRVNEYSSIFACSDVAVVDKEWLLVCLTKGKFVSIIPFLQHNATKEQLKRLDYGDGLL